MASRERVKFLAKQSLHHFSGGQSEGGPFGPLLSKTRVLDPGLQPHCRINS